MRKFKINTGAYAGIYDINKENFERETKQQKPYYTQNEWVQYAVCPACDNPIQVLGLYKQLKNTGYPYGRHHLYDIKGLTKYNQQAYDNCPYSRKNTEITPKSRKKCFGEFERSIYYLMKEQFDRVVYVLSKQIDIKITHKTAKKMLETYYQGEGWMYSWSTLNNLPWVFCHLTWSKPLFGQPILKNSELYAAIVENCSNAVFRKSDYYTGYEILGSKNGKYLDINYCMIAHKRSIKDEILSETMEFIVTEGDARHGKDIFSRTVAIDEAYFLNLVNLSENKSYRNKHLLDIANEIMEPLVEEE